MCILTWLEGGWTACMSYQSPTEWVEVFSEHEMCHDSLESTRDILKQQNLLEVFWKADLYYSGWWVWTDIAHAMSHWSIVGRCILLYILLSHLQAHGEPICNVVLHGHLMCCGFGSVPLLLRVCFSSLFFFFCKSSYRLQITSANTSWADLNQTCEGKSAIT